VDKFQSEIRIPNVCKSNSNFKTEVQKFELHLTSLMQTPDILVSIQYTWLIALITFTLNHYRSHLHYSDSGMADWLPIHYDSYLLKMTTCTT